MTYCVVTTDILSFKPYLHEGVGIPIMIVGQLLRRQPWASSRDFNVKIVETNTMFQPGGSLFGITGVFGVIWITSATMEFIYYAQNNPFMLWQRLQCTNIGATYAQHYCTSNQNSGQYKFLF